MRTFRQGMTVAGRRRAVRNLIELRRCRPSVQVNVGAPGARAPPASRTQYDARSSLTPPRCANILALAASVAPLARRASIPRPTGRPFRRDHRSLSRPSSPARSSAIDFSSRSLEYDSLCFWSAPHTSVSPVNRCGRIPPLRTAASPRPAEAHAGRALDDARAVCPWLE